MMSQAGRDRGKAETPSLDPLLARIDGNAPSPGPLAFVRSGGDDEQASLHLAWTF